MQIFSVECAVGEVVRCFRGYAEMRRLHSGGDAVLDKFEAEECGGCGEQEKREEAEGDSPEECFHFGFTLRVKSQ